jgi:hypothetical protein
MQKRIIVLKKGVEKKEIFDYFCCAGAMIPFMW